MKAGQSQRAARFGARALGLVIGPALLAFGLSRCSETTAPVERRVSGAEITVGQGTARAELIITRTSLPVSLAVVLTEGALSGLPSTMPGPEFVLPLPTEAASLPFNHVTLNWNPGGHPPAGIYDKPHFDIHYYLITPAQRDAIAPADPQFAAKTARLPAADQIPANYAGDPFAIPRMGVHWFSPTAPERQNQAFAQSFLYGFYDGSMIFLEPMVTVAFLQTHPDVTVDLAQPARYPKPGLYPTRNGVKYDAARREFRIELSAFVARN